MWEYTGNVIMESSSTENVVKEPYKPDRDVYGKFSKGSSGNPGGRPKNGYRIMQFALKNLDLYLSVMHELIMNEDTSPRDRISMLKEMFQQAEGKVATRLLIKHESDEPSQMSGKKLEEEIGKMIASEIVGELGDEREDGESGEEESN